jgi:hypothetical protein
MDGDPKIPTVLLIALGALWVVGLGYGIYIVARLTNFIASVASPSESQKKKDKNKEPPPPPKVDFLA